MDSLFPEYTRVVRVVTKPRDYELERKADDLEEAGYWVDRPDESSG